MVVVLAVVVVVVEVPHYFLGISAPSIEPRQAFLLDNGPRSLL